MQGSAQKDGRSCKSSRRSSNQHMQSVLLSDDHHCSPTATTAASSSFFKDHRKISIGDCALFKSPQDCPPFIGLIRCLRLNKEKNLQLGVNRLYRTAELKPGSGTLVDTPNEVFYSSHKDETPAASLLHPCKVAFLPRGVNLPEETSSFVCRRIYDISNKCLWWLTDQNFANELQKEVDWLLNKTRIEMHAALQPDDRSPKQVNHSSSTSPLASASESGQSSKPFASQVKGKKRERLDQGTDHVKRVRSLRTDGCEFQVESNLKSEISQITEKGGLMDLEVVEKLVQIMQSENTERKLDLAGRSMVANVIAATDKVDCLIHFLQLRGLPVMDDWLQDIHKGKIGDDNASKDNDRYAEDFLLVLLCALDKLPVNLHALQMCNIGRSVNHLRTHKNLEIQRKARSLVDTWKKRVQVEMNSMDAKNHASKTASPRSSHGENNIKSATSSPRPVKPASSPAFGNESKRGISSGDVSSSDQSHYLLGKDDMKSSTAGSLTVNKISKGSGKSSSAHKATASTSQLPEGLIAEGSSHKLIVKIPNQVDCPTPGVRDEPKDVLTGSAAPDEDHSMTNEDSRRAIDAPPTNELDSGKLQTTSLSPINALIESCVNNSDANSSMSFEDDVGMNLLASVAACEMSKSDLVSHNDSPERSIPAVEGVYNGDESKPVSFPKDYKVDDPSPASKDILDVEKVSNGKSNNEIHEKSTSSNVTTDDSNCKSDGSHVMMTEEKSSTDLPSDVDKLTVEVAASNHFSEVESERELSEELNMRTNSQKKPCSAIFKSDLAERENNEKVQQNADCQVSVPEADATVNAEAQQNADFRGSKSSSTQPDWAVECAIKASSSAAGASTSDMGVKMKFDLNECFNGDDGNYGDSINLVSSVSTTLHMVTTPPLPVLSVPSGYSAEPRIFFEPPLLSTQMSCPDASTSKQRRAPLDIDLNVPDERVLAEIALRDSMSIVDSMVDSMSNLVVLPNKVPGSEPVRGSGWPDFDLNRADETSDISHFTSSSNRKGEGCSEHVKPLNSLPTNVRRNFDLNSGPGNDDTSTKQLINPQIKGVPQSQLSSADLSMNGPVLRSFSSLSPSGNTYSTVAVPSMLPDRRAQQFPFYSGVSPFTPDIYRGQVLSSSPALPFTSSSFQFPVFPFGTNFHLPPAVFSAAYADSASGPGLFAPPVNPQLFPMPYTANPVNRSNNSGLENNRKLGREGLDLNAGLGGRESEEMLPMSSSAQNSQALVEEHARMRPVSGGISKRKEPDGSWENESFRYRQSSWR